MNIIIIGGTSGIGLALAKYYLSFGHNVVICGRDLTKVPEAIKKTSLSMYQLDVSKSADIINFFDSLKETSLDMLIYSAGKYFNERRLNLTEDEQQEMKAVNQAGFTHSFDLASQQMKHQGHGHLVTISSVAGLVHSASPTLYSTLKAEMITQAKHYAAALSTHNIYVTIIAPGYINTQKLKDLNGGDTSHKPFLIEVHKAVKNIVNAITKKKKIAVFPLRMKLLIYLLNSLPSSLVSYLLGTRR